MSDSEVRLNDGSTAYVGQDATLLFAAVTLRSAIKLHKKTGMIPTRGMTITKMLAQAGKIANKTYRRGEHDRAINDLTIWINTMKAAIPVVDNRS